MGIIEKQMKEAEIIINAISNLKDRVDDFPSRGDDGIESILKRLYSKLDKAYDSCDILISYLEFRE